MVDRHSLLIVEGPQDVAFFSNIAEALGFKRSRLLSDVPEFWKPFIPERFPASDNKKLERVVIYPETSYNIISKHTLAIIPFMGGGNLLDTVRYPLELKYPENFHSIGVVVDADWEVSPQERFSSARTQLEILNMENTAANISGFPLALPGAPAKFSDGNPKVGLYVLPDNKNQGNLESILIECAKENYPKMVSALIPTLEIVCDGLLEECPKATKTLTPSGRQKAIAGLISSVVEPGSSLAVSINSSHWLSNKGADQPMVVALRSFLESLLS
jgi:hypothetical protein